MSQKRLMPPNCSCITKKWVVKIKCNYVYQACHVAYGYSQVPGVNFSKNYSPVVNSITFYILLLLALHFSYLVETVNVENTFLYGNLEEEVYMESPHGISHVKRMTASFSTSASIALFKQHGNIIKRLSRF